MKTNFFKITVLTVLCLLCTNLEAVARTKPTEPQVKRENLTDSTDYYLYNVGADLYVHYNPASSYLYVYKRTLDYERFYDFSRVKLIVRSDMADRYQFKFQNGRYLYANYTRVDASSTGSNNDFFTIRDTIGGLLMQKSPENKNYRENHYLGFADNNDYLVADLTAGNITWKLLPALYVSRVQLYNLLEKAEAQGYPIDEYDAVYNNSSSSEDELNAAYSALYRQMSLTQSYKSVFSGDYAFFVNDETSSSWQIDNLFVSLNMNGGQQAVLSATVDVDTLSTLFYNVYNQNYDGNIFNSSFTHEYHNNEVYRNSHSYRFSSYTDRYAYVDVYIDGQLVRTINRFAAARENNFYFDDLTPGRHTIRWVANCPEGRSNQFIRIKSIRVEKTPEIAVNLVEPGSLGTEVLYQLNRIQDVRRIKISGKMNSDDWKQIDNMTRLFALDLSETNLTSIPADQLHRGATGKSLTYLYKVKLPKSLEVLGNGALYGLNIDEIELPSTLTSIGNNALLNTNIREVNVPEGVTSIGTGAFSYCLSLTKAHLPSQLPSIESRLFYLCYELQDLVIPETVTRIASGAFARCMKYKANFSPRLESIGEYAFFDNYALDSLTINPGMTISAAAFSYTGLRHLRVPRSVNFGCLVFQGSQLQTVTIDENTVLNIDLFRACTSLKQITLPSSYYYVSQMTPALRDCSALSELCLKSPTMVMGTYKDRFLQGCPMPTLKVPDFLVTTYKQDPYWKECNIVGFPSDEVGEWHIKTSLTLGTRDRMEGNPDIFIDNSGRLTINGDMPMNIHDLTTYMDMRWPNTGWSSELISNCENVAITGTLRHQTYMQDNTWYMMTLPFDFRVSDIETTEGNYYTFGEQATDFAKFAIRYYDGAHRAAYGNSGNWVNFPADTIVTAGTGFIIRTSKSCYLTFKAVDNASKQIIVSNNIFAKALDQNPSDNESHRGWNLVGNPYPCYYNIHKLGTQAPITVYEYEWKNIYYGNTWSDRQTNPKYKAYSLIDDDYAIKPYAAFFIQCPAESYSITYPTAGRQLTSVITDQTGIKGTMPRLSDRPLIDLELSDGTDSDQTRVVFNAKASLQYEISCDASKFMSEQPSTQLYTIGERDLRYAINERPEQDGIVALGMTLPKQGTYSLSVARTRSVPAVILHDKLSDTYTDISLSAYDFDAEAGTLDNRFELVSANASAIADLRQPLTPAISVKDGQLHVGGVATVYSLDGRRVAQLDSASSLSLPAGIYVVTTAGGMSRKVIVK